MKTIPHQFNNFEKNYCSIAWAIRLKEIGVRQDTCAYYLPAEYKLDGIWHIDDDEIKHIKMDERIAAYSVQDFIDIFPDLFKLARSENEWKFYCEAADMHLKDETILANVFARILISITKNKNENKRLRVIK